MQSLQPTRKRMSRIILPAKALLQFPPDVDLCSRKLLVRSPTAMTRANEMAQNNGGIRFYPMPPSMKQALTCLEFETYSALEHMEFEVGPDASIRLKRTLAAAPRRHQA